LNAANIERLLRRAHIALLISAAALSLAGPAPAADPALVTLRPCFGAASRDATKPCPDPSLRLTIFPAPADALLEPNAPCHPIGRTELLYPCRFGMRPAAAGGPTETIALVGDSHAAHWRAAVEVVAVAKRRPAISLSRSRCPFIDATIALPRPDRIGCRAWNREVKAYLASHPEITMLFISVRASAEFVRDRGTSNFETQVAGHISQWRSLPASIEHIVVIRDTPRSSAATALCVQRAYAQKREAGRRCARSRSRALRPDAALAAARRMRSARVHAIDLSRFFCDARRCFAVIGGAHVYKDVDHMTAVFARTLGPYLLRAYDRILRTAPPAPARKRIPLDGLLADERAAAECLLNERRAASAAGGFQNVAPERLARANACRAMLEQRVAELRALGLTGERNRDRRYALIVAVLET
jgi:SGNH domain (fused to AT3 domains)